MLARSGRPVWSARFGPHVTATTRRRPYLAMSLSKARRMSRAPARLSAALALSLLAASALGAASAAQAQEVIETSPGGAGAPPASMAGPPPGPGAVEIDHDQSPEAIGAWGRRVLAGDPAPREQAADGGPNGQRAAGCTPPPDNKPHGEVWAGAGTGGYRNVGGVVTQPIGSCGSVTLMIDHSQADYRWRR